MESIGLIIAVAVVVIVLLWLLFYFVPVGLWFKALLSGVRISLMQLILMRWRKVPATLIVNEMITGMLLFLLLSSICLLKLRQL